MKKTLHLWGVICLLLLWTGAFVVAQNTPGLNIGGTGTSSTQSQGALPVVASGGNSFTFSSVGTSGYFVRSGGTGIPTFLDLFGTANTWSASQALNGGVTSTGTVNLTSGILRVPNSNTLPGTCNQGELHHDNDATLGQRLCSCEATNTWRCSSSSAGVFLIADDFYDAVNPGTAPAVGTSDTKFALFAARYAMMQLGSSTGAATPLPAGTIKFWSLDVTDNDATCVFTATLQIDKVDSGTYTCTMTDLSTARRQCFVSSDTAITAGQNVRMKYTTGSTCSAVAYQRPVATLYVLPN